MPIRKERARSCPDLADFWSFLHGVQDPAEVQCIQDHLLHCEGCRTRLHLWRHHSEHLFEEFVPGTQKPVHGCLSRLQLEHLERETLKEGQLVRMQGHVVRCSSCWMRFWDTSTRGPESMALFSTRSPDVDLRLGSDGVDIREGRDALVTHEPAIGPGLELRFRLQRAGSEMELRLGLGDPRVLHLGLRRLGGEARPYDGTWLSLWTRKRIVGSFEVVGGSFQARDLPRPGCYFVGGSVFGEPLLGVGVDRAWSRRALPS